MPDLLTSFSVEIENFALVTHKVPAARVEPHVPENLRLQTFEDAGRRYCLVSVSCFCNRRFRITGLRYPHLTFNESTYRIYVEYNGRQGVFFIGRYLGHPLAVAAQKPLHRDTWLADFEVTVERSDAGFARYDFLASGPRGETTFSISAEDDPRQRPPFDSAWDHTQFITYRTSGLFMSPFGVPGHMPVSHPHMRCVEGVLHAGRFDLWHELGIVEPEEIAEPYSVLAVPFVPFTLHPPRLTGRDRQRTRQATTPRQ
ncbi:MAG: DUF2071 domain-containing protein [Actinomycetota bacterium]|nr:DUF2071 domain-containing protein [Actinomycetota bacterium]